MRTLVTQLSKGFTLLEILVVLFVISHTKNSLKNLNTEKNVMSLLGALCKNHLEINKTLTHSVCMILNVLEISKLKYENS